MIEALNKLRIEGNIENFSSEIRNKARMPTVATTTQQSTRSSSQSN